jgi:hypothetical protein
VNLPDFRPKWYAAGFRRRLRDRRAARRKKDPVLLFGQDGNYRIGWLGRASRAAKNSSCDYFPRDD